MQRAIAGVICFLVAVASPDAQADESAFHTSDRYGRLDFSPDGTRLAVGGSEGQAHVWDFETKRITNVLRSRGQQSVDDVAWAPDGTVLATGDRWGRISVHDIAGDKELRFLSPRDWLGAGHNSWSLRKLDWNGADGSIVLATGTGFSAWHPNEPGMPKVVVEPRGDSDRFSAWHAAVSADGMKLAQVSEGGRFRVRNLSSGEIAIQSNDFTGCQVYLAWSPDSRRVALSSKSTLRILDAATGAIVHDVTVPGQSSIPAWSPDGRAVAVAQGWLNRWSGSDKPDRRISIIDPNRGVVRQTLDSRLKNIEALAWSPDGRILASTGSSKTWTLDEDGAARVVTNPAMPVTLWDADSGRALGHVTGF